MPTIKTFALLDSIMSGQQVKPEQIDSLVVNKVTEDLHLEYKHGDELKKGNHSAATIRQYISGFANGDGGTLIIGIDDKQWKVTGCSAPGGGDLAEWASRSMTSLAPYLSPPPRIQVVQHSDGNVLIIATYRSYSLVPVIEGGRLAYYLRLGEQTLPAPDYLLSDLVLGRRQRPQLRLTRVDFQRANDPIRDAQNLINFTLSFDVVNEGLSWADYVSIGIVYWTVGENDQEIPRQILSNLDVIQPAPEYINFHLAHATSAVDHSESIDIPGFASRHVSIRESITLPFDAKRAWLHVWKTAAYILAKNSAPIWYQLNIETMQPSDILGAMPNGTIVAFQPMLNERPIVVFKRL